MSDPTRPPPGVEARENFGTSSMRPWQIGALALIALLILSFILF